MRKSLIVCISLILTLLSGVRENANAGTFYKIKTDSIRTVLKNLKPNDPRYFTAASELLYLLNTNREREALDFSRRLLTQARQIKSSEGEMAALYGKAKALYIAAATDSSQIVTEQLLDLAETNKNDYWKSEALLNKGWIYHKLTLNKDALDVYKEALTIKQKINDNLGLAKGFLSYGVAFGMHGSWDETMRYYQKAQQYALKAANMQVMASSYGNMAVLYLNVDSLDKAESFARRAYRINDSLGFKNNISLALMQLSNIAQKRKNYDEAISMIEQAITISTLNQVVFDITGLYLGYADLLLLVGDVGKAEVINEYGLKFAEKTDDLNMRFRLINQRVKILITSKKFKEATDLFQKLDSIQQVIHFKNNSMTVYAISRSLETELKNKELAVKEAEIASQKRINGVAFGVISVTSVLAVIIFIQFRRQLHTRRALEEARTNLELRNEELQSVNLTKDKLLSIIGHDLRGPIGSYARVSEVYKMMLAKGNTDAINELMDELERSAYQTLRMLDNLMKWAISQSGQFELSPTNIPLRDLLEDASAHYSETLNAKKISLEITPAKGLFVFGDKESLETAFRNLISNAVKYTYPGGKVVVEARSEGDTIHVVFQDFGLGMSEEQLSMLFSPNKKKGRRGTVGEGSSGLGLLLVQEMIRINKGTIAVQSSEGMGTVVVVILPAAKLPAA